MNKIKRKKKPQISEIHKQAAWVYNSLQKVNRKRITLQDSNNWIKIYHRHSFTMKTMLLYSAHLTNLTLVNTVFEYTCTWAKKLFNNQKLGIFKFLICFIYFVLAFCGRSLDYRKYFKINITFCSYCSVNKRCCSSVE